MKRIHRYNQFKMLKEGRSYEVDLYQAIDFINNQATEWSIENKQIFRGIQDSEYESFQFIEPSSHERTSVAVDDNIYNVMVDNLSSWKEYPKRHHSVYGMFVDEKFNNGKDATEWVNKNYNKNLFGYVNFLIPENNSLLAVCPSNDFRTSLQAGSGRGVKIVEMTKIINHMNKHEYGNKLDMGKWEGIQKILNEFNLDKLTSSEYYTYSYDNLIIKMKESGYSNLLEFCNDGFSPENNEMELTNYSENNINTMEGYYAEGSEVWTDADCLIVSPKSMSEVLEHL